MSLNSIANRDIPTLRKALRKLETTWESEKPEARAASATYRRDEVLMDILGLKVDVITLALAAKEQEVIKEQYDNLMEVLEDILNENRIIRRALGTVIRAENAGIKAQNKQ